MYILINQQFNQMEEEEFDQFEEATYSTSTTHAQNANSNLDEFSPPISANNSNQYQTQPNIIQPFSTPSYNPNFSLQVDLQPSQKSEQTWPHLGKINSAQEPTENVLFLDFTKNNSLKQEKRHTEQQQLFNYTTQSVGQANNNIFLPTFENNNKETSQPKIENNDFLFGFSSPENNIGFDKGSNKNMEEVSEKVNIFDWQKSIQTPKEYTSTIINAGDYGLISQVSNKNQLLKQANFLNQQEKPTKIQQNEVHSYSTEVKENPSLIENNLYSFQTMRQPQYQNVHKSIESDKRKQSQQFVFEQRVQESNAPKQEQRKQSQQFVFQQQHQPIQQLQPQIQQLPQKDADSQQVSSLPLAFSQQPFQQKQSIQEGDDDDFGDFQQTTANNEMQVPSNTKQQESMVHVKEEYLNSHQSDFYRTKEKELQNFVSCLPDYSMLFKKAFVV